MLFDLIFSICDEFEEMSMNAGERPKETAEVVALQNYLQNCREDRIIKLKDEIKKAAERVIFLLYHAKLDGKISWLKYAFVSRHYENNARHAETDFQFHCNRMIWNGIG